MADCLVISPLADDFASEIRRLSNGGIDAVPCSTAAGAQSRYSGESILFGNPQMIAELLAKMPDVRWVQSSWAGVTPLINHPRRDYQLTGVKDVFGPQMAEYVLGYLLAHELRILERREHQQARSWFPEASGVLTGKRLGVLGTGSIGSYIAGAAHGFGLRPTGLSRSGRTKAPFEQVFDPTAITDFLRPLDYVVAALPATAETQHLLNQETLAALPRRAVLVNVGRSATVNTQHLLSALDNGSIAGAVLDVFDEEPLPATSPVWSAKNLTVTAHIAAISHPLLVVPIFVDNYHRHLEGRELRYLVDFEAGY